MYQNYNTYKYLKDNNNGSKKVLWNEGKSFMDLQALNLIYIQGFLDSTPYVSDKLDPESFSIHKELNILNRLDVITVGSQPYIESSNIMGKSYRQRPYIDFYYPTFKVDNLIRNVIGIRDSIVVQCKNFIDNRIVSYNLDAISDIKLKNGRFPLSQDLIGKSWIENYNTSYDFDKNTNDEYIFGENFAPMVSKELTHVFIADNTFTNHIFKIIINQAYTLLSYWYNISNIKIEIP